MIVDRQDRAGMAEPVGSGQIPVAVVGAGPTGLFLAVLLARLGVPVRIFDKEPGAAKESRAFAIHARTLELFASVGLSDAVFERGTLASGTRFYINGKAAAGFGLEFGERPDTPFPVVMVLPQSETEKMLVADLRRLGVEVERGVRLESLTQDASGVVLRGHGADGSSIEIGAAYAVGADGAHSMVRKALGLTFEGGPYAQGFLLADCTVEADLEEGPFTVFLHGQDFGLFFPMGEGHVGRVIVTDGAAQADPSMTAQGSAPATLAEVEDALRRASQLDLRLRDATWTSRYRVHHRGVNRYSVGRVFVAGDAAHIHSPAGGQGMNTGLQDAANLAWKLALSTGGVAPPALLASYDAERRPVGEQVIAVTDRAFSFITASSSLLTTIRDLALPFAGTAIGRSETLRSRVFDILSQLGFHYGPGPAVAPDDGHWSHGPKPGQRAPDAAVAHGVQLFDRTGSYRFHILALARRPLGTDAIDGTADQLDALAAACGLDPTVVFLSRSLAGRHRRILQIENDAVLAAYGVTGDVSEALYLIRPDGHVAWRSKSFDIAGCRRFAADHFAAPARDV